MKREFYFTLRPKLWPSKAKSQPLKHDDRIRIQYRKRMEVDFVIE